MIFFLLTASYQWNFPDEMMMCIKRSDKSRHSSVSGQKEEGEEEEEDEETDEADEGKEMGAAAAVSS